MEQKYIRKGHIIRDMAGKVIFTGMWGSKKNIPSINAAKRESRYLQNANLGRGLLRVAA